MQNRHKIVVILGPTASGKSDLAIKLAKKFDGEIISADSRQVYNGLNIGTGKVTKKEIGNIPHYLLDIISPKKQYTVVNYKKDAEKAIEKILKKNKLPIICGGTGFYIQAIVDNIDFPFVKPNKKLREKLEKKSIEQLLKMLKKLDSSYTKNIDQKNKRKLIRAIEILKNLSPNPLQKQTGNELKNRQVKSEQKYNFLQVGIKVDNKILRKRIHDRLVSRIKTGMVSEIKNLHKKGLSWKRMEELGLEYRYLSRYLKSILSKQEMLEQLENKIWQYSRRQITWFKRDKKIKWFNFGEYLKIENTIKKFLK